MNKRYIYLIVLAMLATALCGLVNAADKEDYCVIPPYVSTAVAPNILVIMDNSYVNGLPAYTTGLANSPAGMPYYDPGQLYQGLYQPNTWYYYDGSKFVPSTTATSSAVFEGNLLNWVTTSRYDIIEKVLEGGKSTSRQTNVNTLVGVNSGTWATKYYEYVGTDNNYYACKFVINEGNSTGLKIYDLIGNMGGVNCSLIATTPVRPAVSYRHTDTSASLRPDGPSYASETPADVKGEAAASGSRLWGLLNDALSLFAGEAEAALQDISIISPLPGAQLPAANRFDPYAGFVPAASGGDSGVYEWIITGLPSGLTYNSTTGAISGTTSVAQGTYNLTITVYDRYILRPDGTLDLENNPNQENTSVSATLQVLGQSLAIDQPVSGAYVTDAFQGIVYSGYSPRATGGYGTYSWTVSGLPSGLTYSTSTGAISGTTGASTGDYTITFNVTDSKGATASRSAKLKVRVQAPEPGALSILYPTDGATLPYATRYEPYEAVVAVASGGTGSYAWSASPTSPLPPGMSINPSSGQIEGSPDASALTQEYTSVIQVTDGTSTASVTVKITVVEVQLVITSPLPGEYLPAAMQYVVYTGYTPTVTGGTGSYTWRDSDANPLPSGMGVNPSTGLIYGTPDVNSTAPQTYNVVLEVYDGYSRATVAVRLVLNRYPLKITWPYNGYNIGDVVLNTSFTGRFRPQAIGGSGSYTWSVVPDATPTYNLPPGLTLAPSNGAIQGITTTATLYGTYYPTLRVTDNITGEIQQVRISMYIYNPSSQVLVSVPMSFPTATVGIPYGGYSQTFYYGYSQGFWQASGLPSDLFIDPRTGLIYGTTFDLAGIYNVTVSLTTYNAGVPYTTSFSAPLQVVGSTAPRILPPAYTPYPSPIPFSMDFPGSGYTLPDGVQGSPYSGFTPSVVGGTGSYTWTITNLPTGMTYDPLSGYISGTPTVSGDYNNVGIKVDDGSSSSTVTATLKIWPYDSMVLTVPANGAALPSAQAEAQYSFSPSATGGDGEYVWDISGLPTGLTFNAASGLISGVPASGTENTYTVLVQVTDGTLTQSALVTLEVLPALTNARTFNIRVCAGTASVNCTNTSGTLKEGLLSEIWGSADLGLIDFTVVGQNANVSQCVPASNEPNYHTAVENAVPTGSATSLTKLVNGLYEGVRVFMGQNSAPVCDPFPSTDASNKCKKNYILLLTDGSGANNGTNVFGTTSGTLPSPACDGLTSNLVKNACYGYNNDLRSATLGKDEKVGTQKVSTYVVHVGSSNVDTLRAAANISDGLYKDASNLSTLADELRAAFRDMIKRSASGTAASVLASGEGSGANLIQAVYYPKVRAFDSATTTYDEISWVGRLTNLWYYVDPFFGASQIYADTDQDKVLDVNADDRVRLYFDDLQQATMAELTNTTGSEVVAMEDVSYLWEAGRMLWNRDITTDQRTIYAYNGTTFGVFNSTSAQDAYMRGLMNVTSVSEAEDVINFVHGSEVSGARSRAIKLDLNGDGDTLDPGETVKQVWKLGDVLNSTPRLATWIPLNNYHKAPYKDETYGQFVSASAYTSRGMAFAGSNDGMIHAFNLGDLQMPGDPAWPSPPSNQKARLAGTELGKEMWAFIPKNVLPYLRYQLEADYCHIYSVDLSPYVFDASIAKDPVSPSPLPPSYDVYCTDSNYWHCNKTVNSWKTILIGGMRTGGACKNRTTACTEDLDGSGSVDSKDCVNTPVDNTGYSSYFALDVTDPENPQMMWEFTNPGLGYTTTGPSIVRINGKDDTNASGTIDDTDLNDPTKNGRWFVVIGSGPTGPIETQHAQFLGNSDQPLQFFVLDLKTGSLVRTFTGTDTLVDYGFAGSMINVTNDSDEDYSDEAVYVGYTKRTSTTPYAWNQGGVGRILTNESLNPTDWVFGKLIDNIGPVTSSIVKLQDDYRNQLWLFFGTGRSFYKIQNVVDDHSGLRRLFGVRDKCYVSESAALPFDSTCSSAVTPTIDAATELDDMTDLDNPIPASSASYGWKISMEPAGTYSHGGVSLPYSAERVITDPVTAISGIVFFTSHKPYSQECAMGGKSFIWAIDYATGQNVVDARLKGSALIQVSTGAIEKINLSSDTFTDMDSRRSGDMEGVPPTAQGFSLFLPPKPLERIMHKRER